MTSRSVTYREVAVRSFLVPADFWREVDGDELENRATRHDGRQRKNGGCLPRWHDQGGQERA